jgi:hypothetical protein
MTWLALSRSGTCCACTLQSTDHECLASRRLVADYHGAGIVVERASLDKGDPAHIHAAIQQVARPAVPSGAC